MDEIKNNYNTNISRDLNDVIINLNNSENIMINNVFIAEFTKPNLIWSQTQEYYDELDNSLKSYNNKYVFNLSEDKNSNLLYFYNNSIIPFITSIPEQFNNEVKIGQDKLKEALKNSSVGDTVNSMLVNIRLTQMKNNVRTTKNLLSLEIEQFKKAIVNEFKDFPSVFKNKIKNINITGFDEDLRNLEEYNLLEIEEVFDSIEKKYEEFRQKILTYEKYDNILTQKSGFITVTFNSTSTLTNDFYAYKHLITQYTNDSKIEEYFGLLENNAEEIRNKDIIFIIDCSNEINYSINIINYGMRDSWNEIRKIINPYIYETLDEVFTEKFSNLIDLSENNNIPEDYKFNHLTIEIVNSNREIIGTKDFDINIVNQFGYSLKRINNYDFKIEVYIKSAIDFTIITHPNNIINEIISGRLTSGKVGTAVNYYLHYKSIDEYDYANLDEVNYTISINKIDNWQETYKTNKYIPPMNVSLNGIKNDI